MSNELDQVSDWRLAEVRLERFKAAFRPNPIALLPFNLVIGRNGSGKSTLLEGLQWLDTTIREDARRASDRYNGARDLINLRSPRLFFQITLTWASEEVASTQLRYQVKVDVDEKTGAPAIAEESLVSLGKRGKVQDVFLRTTKRGERSLSPSGEQGSPLSVTVREPDRLALGLVGSASVGPPKPELSMLQDFWQRAVFLRLSPNRLAYGSLATRKSFEPLLDEEGQNLPALLNELSGEQRDELRLGSVDGPGRAAPLAVRGPSRDPGHPDHSFSLGSRLHPDRLDPAGPPHRRRCPV
jgi:predicted ATPase